MQFRAGEPSKEDQQQLALFPHHFAFIILSLAAVVDFIQFL